MDLSKDNHDLSQFGSEFFETESQKQFNGQNLSDMQSDLSDSVSEKQVENSHIKNQEDTNQFDLKKPKISDLEFSKEQSVKENRNQSILELNKEEEIIAMQSQNENSQIQNVKKDHKNFEEKHNQLVKKFVQEQVKNPCKQILQSQLIDEQNIDECQSDCTFKTCIENILQINDKNINDPQQKQQEQVDKIFDKKEQNINKEKKENNISHQIGQKRLPQNNLQNNEQSLKKLKIEEKLEINLENQQQSNLMRSQNKILQIQNDDIKCMLCKEEKAEVQHKSNLDLENDEIQEIIQQIQQDPNCDIKTKNEFLNQLKKPKMDNRKIQDSQSTNVFQILSCDHAFHEKCLRKTFEAQLYQSQISFDCPQCKLKVQQSDLKNILSQDVYQVYQALL